MRRGEKQKSLGLLDQSRVEWLGAWGAWVRPLVWSTETVMDDREPPPVRLRAIHTERTAAGWLRNNGYIVGGMGAGTIYVFTFSMPFRLGLGLG